jgi:hypothetical protein
MKLTPPTNAPTQTDRAQEVRDHCGGRTQRDPFRRPHASHVSRPEWWMVILVACLVLGMAISHLGNNGRQRAAQWRAEDARMQAQADKP